MTFPFSFAGSPHSAGMPKHIRHLTAAPGYIDRLALDAGMRPVLVLC